jgi:hypothetical protein
MFNSIDYSEQAVKEQLMPKRRSTAPLPSDASALTRRIVVLLDLLWQGNISKMKKALDISHPVLSRVLRGLQEPPGKLLEVLARQSDVNVRWLFAGEGEPLTVRNLWAGGGRFLPIASCLLPGEPNAYPELVTLTSFPVAEALFTETAYWLAVAGDSPIVKHRGSKIQAGDFLLIETATTWTRRLDAVRGRLCALRVPLSSGVELILGQVDNDLNPFQTHYELNTFGLFADAGLLPDDANSGNVVDVLQPSVQFRLPDVVGVVIKLDRIL